MGLMGEYSMTWIGWSEIEHDRVSETSRLEAAVLLAVPVGFLAHVLPVIDWGTGWADICNRCSDSSMGLLAYCILDVV